MESCVFRNLRIIDVFLNAKPDVYDRGQEANTY